MNDTPQHLANRRRVPRIVESRAPVAKAAEISGSEWLSTKADVASVVADGILARSRTFDVRAYGAIGDNVADDTDAIEAAIAAIPNATGYGGAELVFPFGSYRISRPIVIPKHGVHVRSTGGFTAIIQPTGDVSTTALSFEIPDSTVRGARVSDIRFRMNNSPAGAITIRGGYDNVQLDNVFVDGLNGSADGISVLPPIGSPSINISQTVMGLNCWVSGSAGWTGVAWNIDHLQEGTFIGCKGVGAVGYGGGSTGFRVHSSRTIAFYNCSVSNVDTGWLISASDRPVQSFVIDNPLFEQVSNAMRVQGTSSYPVTRVAMRNPRQQSPVGPITLEYAHTCDLDTMTIPVVINASSEQAFIRTRDISAVTDNGSRTTIFEARNSANLGPNYSPSFLVRNASGDTTLRVDDAPSGGTAMFLLTNAAGVTSLRRVSVGAVDSGGSGFRVLRVPN